MNLAIISTWKLYDIPLSIFNDLRIAMSESRSAPRINVSWRGAIKLKIGLIVAIKVVNFSTNGAQLLCAHMLADKEIYQMMIEIPDRRDASNRIQVICQGKCAYCILSGSEYRIGIQLLDVPPEHQALINAWVSGNTK